MCTLHKHKYHAETTAGFSNHMKAVDPANLVLRGHTQGRGPGTRLTAAVAQKFNYLCNPYSAVEQLAVRRVPGPLPSFVEVGVATRD